MDIHTISKMQPACTHTHKHTHIHIHTHKHTHIHTQMSVVNTTYILSNKNPSAWNFLSRTAEPEVTCGTVAIIIRVVLLSQYLRIRGVCLSPIHYNQSHRVSINRRQQYICSIWN